MVSLAIDVSINTAIYLAILIVKLVGPATPLVRSLSHGEMQYYIVLDRVRAKIPKIPLPRARLYATTVQDMFFDAAKKAEAPPNLDNIFSAIVDGEQRVHDMTELLKELRWPQERKASIVDGFLAQVLTSIKSST